MMAKKKAKKKAVKKQAQKTENILPPKTFLEMAAPTAVSFSTDHYICGGTYRCVLALRSYPVLTEETAILRRLGEKSGVTVHIYTRKVSAAEGNQIIQNAENRNRMEGGSGGNVRKAVTAEDNLQDVRDMVRRMTRDGEQLFHCAVFVELIAKDAEALKNLLDEVTAILTRSKIGYDRLLLKQQDGFKAVNPAGHNCFRTQFERVLPVSSVANLFPLNHSGKNDPHGFYIGRDRYGSDIIVDLDRRADDKTNANVVILGNSGQGKSYLSKLLLCNLLESGKSILCFDPEHENAELCQSLGGCFISMMNGQHIVNILEPKSWGDGDEEDEDAPAAFRQKTKLSQHISFLKDVFRAYKDFSDQQIDTIEIMLSKLYAKWNITDDTDLHLLKRTDYPILSDLYTLMEQEYRNYDQAQYPLYTAELLQSVLLGLHSMCVGSESKFFNGHSNISSDRFIVFGVKELLHASQNVRNVMLLNILSFMSDRLLDQGNAAAIIDELYLFLANPIAIEYIRNAMKRARKKDSSVVLASQNLEDFNIPGIAEMTKPLFSIPTHTFLFNAGQIDKKFYVDTLQLKDSEYELIRYPQRGVCLYKCGSERYLLQVQAPEYKQALFGTAGGR